MPQASDFIWLLILTGAIVGCLLVMLVAAVFGVRTGLTWGFKIPGMRRPAPFGRYGAASVIIAVVATFGWLISIGVAPEFNELFGYAMIASYANFVLAGSIETASEFNRKYGPPKNE